MFIQKWLERRRRYSEFEKMLETGTLLGDGNICVAADQIIQCRQTKTISQLIALGYAQLDADRYIISHTEDLEQVITRGIRGRYSSSKWLRNAVNREKFKNLVNDSIGTGVQLLAFPDGNEFHLPAGHYIRLTQERVQTWKCIEEMAQLASRGLVYIVEDQGKSVLFLTADYLSRVHQPLIVIDSDLGGFRTMLGEPGNIRRMIMAVEQAECADGEFVIDLNSSSGRSVRLELMSLVDAGVAALGPDGTVTIPPAVASWLLEQVKHVSGRVSLSDILEGSLGQ